MPKGKSWLGGFNGIPGEKEVEIPADFYLGKYMVTQEEWTQVMEENPSHFSRKGGGMEAVKDINDADLKRFPVENVSWDQCQTFVAKLNELEKETGWVYRLPKEAEWEYACRGGPMAEKADSAFDFYFAKPTNTLLREQANFGLDKGLNRTCKVGLYDANPLGLYDMHGNVWEWCDDTYIVPGASLRVRRGGSWGNSEGCRARDYNAGPPSDRTSHLGLRLARVPSGVPSPEAKTPPIAIAPFDAAQAKKHQEEWSAYLKVPVEHTNSIGMKFTIIPAGKFTMGSPDNESGRHASEARHEIIISKSFYLGAHPVTVAQFGAFVKESGYKNESEKDHGAWTVSPSGWKHDSKANWQKLRLRADRRLSRGLRELV